MLFLPVVEGAVRFGIAGGIVVPLLLAPFLACGEMLRADRYGRDFNLDAVTFPLGLDMLMGLLVGWLAARLGERGRPSPTRGPARRSSYATSSGGGRISSRP